LEKLNELTRSMSKDHTESKATNQIKDKINDFSAISQSTPRKDSCNETEKGLEEGQPTWCWCKP